MHIPDGFIDIGTSIGAGTASIAGVSVAVRKSSNYLEDKQIPMAGLVAAFVFAVQMLNFPVAGGTSGHLLGGVLAAVFVGPWAGILCISVVLLVQALFADGGLTALGLNVLNMAVVTVLVGYPIYSLLVKILPRKRGFVMMASGVAATISVVAASVAFIIEYALGGVGGVPLGTVATAMVGVHALIGIGEGLITAATVGLVLNVRPDLVHGVTGMIGGVPQSTGLSPQGAGS